MTFVDVSQVEVRSLSVYDQQPVYSVQKCVGLKCRYDEYLCFVVMGTYIIDRSCVFAAHDHPKGKRPLLMLSRSTLFLSVNDTF
jgi:hypothetical protein